MSATKEYLLQILNDPDKEAALKKLLEVIENAKDEGYADAVKDVELRLIKDFHQRDREQDDRERMYGS